MVLAVAERPPMTPVPTRLLLWFYAVVPLGIGLPLLDALFFDSGLRSALPSHPGELAYWALVFNVPHVVASEFILCDREYVGFYRRHIAVALAGVAMVTWLLAGVLDPFHAVWLGNGLLAYHVIGQQCGIGRLLSRNPHWAFTPWRLLATALYLLALAQHFLTNPLTALVGGDTTTLGLSLSVPLMGFFVPLFRSTHGTLARSYLAANQLMFLSFPWLAASGYGFFFILMPRVVHDLTAFTFYFVHDRNRNRVERKNALYRLLAFTRLPPWAILVALSVGAGYALGRIDGPELYFPIAMVSVFHYYMEAVTWRHTGLHRKALAFQ